MKRVRRIPGIIKLAALGLCAWFAVSLIHAQLKIAGYQNRAEELEEKIKAQTSSNETIRDQVENGVSDEYIASLARERGYVSPGERVYIHSSSR